MNTPIDLSSESLQDSDIAEIISLNSKDKFLLMWDSKKGGPVSFPDFGTIFIGDCTDFHNDDCFIRNTETPMTIPTSWKQGHLVKRLGMFPSVSQATKNGFSAEIPNGFSQIFVRINKLKGVLSILKNV